MNGAAWGLLAAFGVVAATDWWAVRRGSKRLEYLCKPGCMAFLVALALVLDGVAGGARAALVAALVLSTAGDVFLMLPGRQPGTPGPNLFVLGLGSFLLAHVAYVVAFVAAGTEGAGLAAGAIAAVVIVATLGVRVVGATRRGDEPELAAPVAAYVVVIAAMVATAIGTTDPRAITGAALFAASDSLIAWERFIRTQPWAPLAIIVTYHLAQALLATSFAGSAG
ncbi:MAG: hypothetical protein H0W25_09445 [Acidimicrobiia bacterium]|nr:hypothetical protein [Acidimicrobiia bacterium]